MKRIIVLFLCAVTVLSCFAACGKTEPAQETETETTADVTEPEETADPNYVADLQHSLRRSVLVDRCHAVSGGRL